MAKRFDVTKPVQDIGGIDGIDMMTASSIVHLQVSKYENALAKRKEEIDAEIKKHRDELNSIRSTMDSLIKMQLSPAIFGQVVLPKQFMARYEWHLVTDTNSNFSAINVSISISLKTNTYSLRIENDVKSKPDDIPQSQWDEIMAHITKFLNTTKMIATCNEKLQDIQAMFNRLPTIARQIHGKLAERHLKRSAEGVELLDFLEKMVPEIPGLDQLLLTAK